MAGPLLSVRDLRVAFHTRNGVVRAVNGVSFDLARGKTIGIVGESGSGKSVACHSMLGLIPQPPGRIEGGTVEFDGMDLLKLDSQQLRNIRGRRISLIFQDPMTSLNPWLRISTQLMEPLQIHLGLGRAEARARAVEALQQVGIPDAGNRIRSYPHEFSGGMRQRVMIAMALATHPEVLIADEPTTALDVTIQKQVLKLIRQRQQALGTAVIFITHDLAVVSEMCDFVHVMYAGRIIEAARTDELFAHPLHAYTRALLRSIPGLQKRGEALYTIPGMPPDLSRPIPGCAFAPRRPEAVRSACLHDRPPVIEELRPHHWVQNCPGCLAAD
ncbi:MAG: ABC transporter ATP-binding protein [Verrucomicrobiales bacterium]|nr:ABC transporter ATP-binding protein [Verrucomicrobiales bacterium]